MSNLLLERNASVNVDMVVVKDAMIFASDVESTSESRGIEGLGSMVGGVTLVCPKGGGTGTAFVAERSVLDVGVRSDSSVRGAQQSSSGWSESVLGASTPQVGSEGASNLGGSEMAQGITIYSMEPAAGRVEMIWEVVECLPVDVEDEFEFCSATRYGNALDSRYQYQGADDAAVLGGRTGHRLVPRIVAETHEISQ